MMAHYREGSGAALGRLRSRRFAPTWWVPVAVGLFCTGAVVIF